MNAKPKTIETAEIKFREFYVPNESLRITLAQAGYVGITEPLPEPMKNTEHIRVVSGKYYMGLYTPGRIVNYEEVIRIAKSQSRPIGGELYVGSLADIQHLGVHEYTRPFTDQKVVADVSCLVNSRVLFMSVSSYPQRKLVQVDKFAVYPEDLSYLIVLSRESK